MSTTQNIEFHIGETWQIDLSAHLADGTVLDFPSGTEIEFRISDDDGTLFTASIASGNVIVISADGGVALITITPEDQVAAGLEVGGYHHEARVSRPDLISIQAEGRFKVLDSLFAAA